MGIGPDIKEVRDELGASFTIVRLNVVEKIDYDIRNPAGDPVAQEQHFDANLSYDTQIIVGDVIQSGGNSFLVMNKTPDSFEDEVVEYAAILFKCNLPDTASIIYPTTTVNQTTFIVTQGWAVRKATPYGLVNPSTRGTANNPDTSTGKDLTYTLECLVPSLYGVEILDRVIMTPTEYFRVQEIEKYKYPGVHILTLVEDERVVYTP